MDEYKILQDKIDKIGGFRFTVKGWSVTLTTAALATAGAARIPYYLLPALILFVVVFFLLEHEQWELSRRFGRRASEIEEALRRFRSDPDFDFDTFAVFVIASELVQRPPEISWARRLWIRARISVVDESFLIYWVQIILIITMSAWLFVQSRNVAEIYL
jgi:hypothetical protein